MFSFSERFGTLLADCLCHDGILRIRVSLDFRLPSQAFKSSVYYRASNIPSMLRLRCQTAVFVENNVTDQTGAIANAGMVCTNVGADDE